MSSDEFDPYYVWLGIPPDQQPPTHYRLLGVEAFEPNADVIANAAEQRMAHLRSAQIGRYAEESQRLLAEVAAAMRVLLDPARKTAYDAQLRGRALGPLPMGPSVAPTARPSPRGSGARNSSMSLGAAPQTKQLPVALPVTKTRAANSSSYMPALLLVGGGAAAIGLLLLAGVAAMAFYLFSRSPADEVASAAPQQQMVQPSSPQWEPEDFRLEPTVTETTEPPAREGVDVTSTEPTPEVEPPIVDEPTEVDAEPPIDTEVKLPPTRIDPPQPVPPVVRTEESPAPPAADEPARLKAPTSAEQQKLLARLTELYPPEKLKTATQAHAAALELLELGSAEDTPSADRFVLLRRASELAVTAGDPQILSQAAAKLGETFDVSAVEIEGAMLVRMAAGIDGARAAAFARGALGFAELAAADGRYDVAYNVVAATDKLPASALSESIRTTVRQQVAALRDRRDRYVAVAAAERAVAVNPSDAAAQTLLARWYCYDENEWSRGLVHLARGENAELRSIAASDLAGATTPAARLALGNAWWDAAQQQTAADKKQLESRAMFWYEQIDPNDVTGLDRALLARRLATRPTPVAAVDDDSSSPADDTRFDALFTKALEAVREKRFGEADRLFAHCVRMRPTDAAAANNYALTALRIGQSQRAVKQWERMLNAGVQAGPVLHNLQRLKAIVDREDLALDRTSRTTLDELIATAQKNAKLSRYRATSGWFYQQAGGATVEDRHCMQCSGQGVVDCPVRNCTRGKVRVMQSAVVGRNTVTGEAIVQTTSVGVPCNTCNGNGTVDCRCYEGIDSRLR